MWHTRPVIDARQILKDRRTRNAGIVAAALAAHLVVFAVIGAMPGSYSAPWKTSLVSL